MTHSELCLETARWAVKKGRLALWEYQSTASPEFPDVLLFKSCDTVLYEIKMSRADFFADAKKEARSKWKVGGWWQIESDFGHGEKKGVNGPWDRIIRKRWISWKSYRPEEFRIQAPHLGSKRFFVCPDGIIMPDEVPAGWGLIWFKDGKFRQKKDSAKFRANVRDERDLVAHAIQRMASGSDNGIVVRLYDGKEGLV